MAYQFNPLTGSLDSVGSGVNADWNATSGDAQILNKPSLGALALLNTVSNIQIASDAEIAVSKLADGSARQLLQTDSAGTGVEWASNIDIPGTLDVTLTATFDDVIVAGKDIRYVSQGSAPSTPATGFRLYANSSHALSWIGQNGFIRTFDGTSNTANRTYTLPDKNGTVALTSDLPSIVTTSDAGLMRPVDLGDVIVLACSDETTDLATGTARVTFRMPWAATLTEVRLSVNTAPTGSALIVDVNEGGVSVFGTRPQIDAGAKTSVGSAVTPVISDSALAADAEITVDIDQVGSTAKGKGLKVALYVTRV